MTIFSGDPEAFDRLCTLDGVPKLLLLWGLRGHGYGRNWFKNMSLSTKMSSKDKQILLLVAFFFQKSNYVV